MFYVFCSVECCVAVRKDLVGLHVLYVEECMMDRERQPDVTIEKNGVAVGT